MDSAQDLNSNRVAGVLGSIADVGERWELEQQLLQARKMDTRSEEFARHLPGPDDPTGPSSAPICVSEHTQVEFSHGTCPEY